MNIKKMKILFIGNGEIGSTIIAQFKKVVENPQIDILDLNNLSSELHRYYDVIHVCIPRKHEFPTQITNYMLQLKASVWLFHTTLELDDFAFISRLPLDAYHVPIRGTHSHLSEHMFQDRLFIGRFNQNKKDGFVSRYLDAIGFTQDKFLTSAKNTIYAKLISVVWFGWNIIFTQLIQKDCIKYGLDFDVAYTKYAESDRVGHKYDHDGWKVNFDYMMSRPVFYPDKIRGKCVIQDMYLLEHGSSHFQTILKYMIEEDQFFLDEIEKLKKAREKFGDFQY